MSNLKGSPFYLGLFSAILLSVKAEKPSVDLGILLPTSPMLYQPIRAVQQAVAAFNQNPNAPFGIHLVINDTGTSTWNLIEATLWQINVVQVVAILGATDLLSAELVSTLAKNRSVALVSPSAETSKRIPELHPTFFRVSPNNLNLVHTVDSLLNHFDWFRLAVIHSDADYAPTNVRSTVRKARTRGYDVVTSLFLSSTRDSLTESEINALRNCNATIYVVACLAEQVNMVLSAASRHGLLTKGTVWIVVYCSYGDDFLDEDTMSGIICIRQKLPYSKKALEMNVLQTEAAVYAHDALQAVVQALKNVPVGRETISVLRSKLIQELRNITVDGLSGKFRLDDWERKAEYEVLNYRNGRLVPFASWSRSRHELVFTSEENNMIWPGGQKSRPFDKVLQTTYNRTIQALVPLSWPFTAFIDSQTGENCTERTNQNNCKFVGIAIDFMERIQDRAFPGAKLNYTLWRGESWDELCRVVGNVSTPWDLAVGSVTINTRRAASASFSRAYYDSSLRMLIRRPHKVVPGYGEIFRPFKWNVWLVVFAVILLLVTPALYYLDGKAVASESARRRKYNGKWDTRFHDAAHAIYFVFCLCFAVHEAGNVTRVIARFYTVIISWTCLILISSYTANLAVFLMDRGLHDHAVKDYKQLLSSRVGCRKGTANWNYVRDELNLGKNLVMVQSGERATQLLRSGNIDTFIGDSPHVMGAAAKDCDFVVVGPKAQLQQYAFPMKPNSPYLFRINREIVRAGLDDKAINLYLERNANRICPPLQSSDDLRSYTVEDVKGLIVLAVATAGVVLLSKFLIVVKTRVKVLTKMQT
ncbi:uncharacterized protein [Oscarella lobularis]|uniref:uncharacterized protein n=1 Tax=Oscarella lobularis TaxID=121494 RepID=UPI003313F17C